MSADEAKVRGWFRLRAAHLHREENPDAKRWDALAVGVAETIRREQRA